MEIHTRRFFPLLDRSGYIQNLFSFFVVFIFPKGVTLKMCLRLLIYMRRHLLSSFREGHFSKSVWV